MFKKLIDRVKAHLISRKLGVDVRIVRYQHQGEPIVGEQLLQVLDTIISPRVSRYGLHWRGDHSWVSESNNGIRKIVHYGRFTKSGHRGYISWGIALDFVLIPIGNKLIYNRTKKTAIIHIGEWADGYLRSFRGKNMIDGVGVAAHYSQIAEKTIAQAIDGELERITTFYDKASDLEAIIEIAKSQLENPFSPFSNMRFPSPAYILAFIYAKLGDIQLATTYLQRDRWMSDPENRALFILVVEKLNHLATEAHQKKLTHHIAPKSNRLD
ncbi:hypothetical protein B5M42_020850 [Paenibacillus athensensis]|uniref:Uncharacterized protein n=1 Tax=Paenibacillus athensensis TaxID=1967502 RepID=A0A4Y8PYJ3_9BACL|nr:hypothetical protein [Paenibacillus athensensis]MCD1261253.1 hypothetical protein [Paenibacillus athensensis]